MANHLLFWRKYLIGAVILFVISGNHYVRAIEVLPPITVTAPKTLSDQIDNPQYLDEEDIAVVHERTITDVIQGFTGIASTKVSSFGMPTTLYLRGADGQGVITLDGVPLLQTLPGFYNLDALPAEAIQSAEIVKGPDLAFRSFQSLGGAIHLSTFDRDTSGGRLSVEGGSFGILRETLQTGLTGALGRATATLSRTDAFDGMHAVDASIAPERDPMHFSQGIFRFNSGLGKRINWQGSLFYRNSVLSIDTYGISPQGIVIGADDPNGHAYEETWLAQNTLNAQLTDSWNSQLKLGYTQSSTLAKLSLQQTGVATKLYLADWHNRHTLFENEQKLLLCQFDWGLQGRHETSEPVTNQFLSRRTMVSGFMQIQGQIRQLSGEAGFRLEHYDQFGDHPLFKASAAWQITPALTLRASGGTGYRLPSFNELLFPFFGNRNLKPEGSASGTLSLEWVPVKNGKLTISGFYNRYDNLIAIAHERQTGPTTRNIADSSVAGMEFDAQYGWTDNLDTGISYTFAESRDLNTGKALPYRPEHIARFWGQQKLTKLPLTLWAETIVRSSTFNDYENTLPVGSTLQLNAAIRYAVSNNLELYLRGENLTNNRTPQVFTANAPGATVYGGFKVDF